MYGTWWGGVCRCVVEVSELLFGERPITEGVVAKRILAGERVLPEVVIAREEMEGGVDVVTLLTTVTKGAIFSSKRVAREMIAAGGVHINRERIVSNCLLADLPAWMGGRCFLVKKGKKKHFLIRCKEQ